MPITPPISPPFVFANLLINNTGAIEGIGNIGKRSRLTIPKSIFIFKTIDITDNPRRTILCTITANE